MTAARIGRPGFQGRRPHETAAILVKAMPQCVAVCGDDLRTADVRRHLR
jgi:hypothetical protein